MDQIANDFSIEGKATDDAGGLVVFVSGRMSTFIMGAVLPLDGGWSVKGLSWHLPHNT